MEETLPPYENLPKLPFIKHSYVFCLQRDFLSATNGQYQNKGLGKSNTPRFWWQSRWSSCFGNIRKLITGNTHPQGRLSKPDQELILILEILLRKCSVKRSRAVLRESSFPSLSLGASWWGSELDVKLVSHQLNSTNFPFFLQYSTLLVFVKSFTLEKIMSFKTFATAFFWPFLPYNVFSSTSRLRHPMPWVTLKRVKAFWWRTMLVSISNKEMYIF